MFWNFRGRTPPTLPNQTTRRRAALRVESLEDRSVPAVFVPNAFGGGNFAPFDNFAGDVRTASGDVNGDGVADIITAQGQGAGSASRVRIYDGAAARFSSQAVLLSDFFAYSDGGGASQTPGFAGGVFVAAADLNGDGFAEVITSPGAGGAGHVKVFDFNNGSGGFLGNNPTLRTSFFAYPGFQGDVRLAAMNRGLGLAPLIVTASGAGTSNTDLRFFDNAFTLGSVANGTLVSPAAQTFVFPGYLGGISLASGNTNAAGSQLFFAPNVGNSLVSSLNVGTSLSGLILTPGTTFSTGFAPPTDMRLGTADINGDNVIDVLTSSVNGTPTPTIVPFSLVGGTATPLSPLNGFQGFGNFNNTWLASSTFRGATPSAFGSTTGAGVVAPVAGTNTGATFFTGAAPTQSFTFGNIPTSSLGTFGGTTSFGQGSGGVLSPGIF